MSWQSFIDNLKMPDAQGFLPVKDAAIWGMLPGQESPWTSTPGLSAITVDEIKKLAHDRSDFRQSGAYIAGRKCMLLTDELDVPNNHTMNLKTAKDADGNTYNMCVGKTKKALIIAMGTKEASGGQLNNKVFKVVEYLLKADM